MRHVERSAIVPYGAQAMFDLVADVASYPEFLPGCTGTRVHHAEGPYVVASIALARGPLRTEFRTRNVVDPGSGIDMTLDDGPFRELAGRWRFTPLGPAGSRVDLRVTFAFASRAMDLVLGPAFESLCNELVDAFVARARAVYGVPGAASR
jgi:ribosome-associated toxin RatA of RatAB toxin-antitoxin module